MTDPNTLPPDKIITGEHLYNEAIHIVLASAQHELLIFDQDLSHGDFASSRRYELFRDFLANHLNSRLVIILQDSSYFLHKCPRLFGLLKIYAHKMQVFVTNDTAKHAKDCFILADGAHYLRRFHIDQARFKYAFHDKTVAESLNLRFNDLKEAIQNLVTVTPLGL
ncbi:MAG: hypothetical protein CVU29_07590 [Betaproteobacteria bacterium HGW-Betaproteobacteria-22]|nr:MAG: hypothetical protein CVU29_07590 [Betaproteobacteria bacterium HGW-Betaproteobacteria-22]